MSELQSNSTSSKRSRRPNPAVYLIRMRVVDWIMLMIALMFAAGIFVGMCAVD